MAKNKNAAALLQLGSLGIVRELTMAADRHVASRGGAPWTPSLKRMRRQMATTVRRRSDRSSLVRHAARGVGAAARPSAVERRAMRRDSYARQGESLSDEQLLSIPANELPADLLPRRKEAMANRPRDEKGRFISAAESPGPTESPASPGGTVPADQRAKIDAEIRAIIGDPAALPPRVREQLEREIAEKFGSDTSPATSSPSEPSPPSPPSPPETPPRPTPAQRKQENVQAVIDSQLEDAPQPSPQRDKEQSGGWIDKLQTGLDAAGVADPTPIADGVNAVISLGRAAFDPKRRREHLQNAGISAVSAAVPYVGDTAKLLKVGRAAKKSQAARGAAKSHEAAGSALPPGGMDDWRPGAPPVQTGAGAAQPPRRGRIRRAFDAFQGGGGAEPPQDPPRFGAPSPEGGDEGDSPRRRREEAEGIAAHDRWVDKLKDGAIAIASFAGKAYLAVEGMRLLNQGVLAINKDLREYSGQLAGSYAEAENADISRDMKRAQMLDGPLSELQKEQTKLNDTMSEFTTPVKAVLITMLSKLTMMVNLGFEVVKMIPYVRRAAEIAEKLSEIEEDSPGGKEFLKDLSDGRFDGFGIDSIGQRFEILDKKTRQQLGLTPQPKRSKRGNAPGP